MVASAITNYILGFVMNVTFLSNLGNVNELINSSIGQPWVALIYRITRSKAATIVLTVLMILMFFFCCINQVTTCSRQLWSFARDRGVPGHRWLSAVRTHSGVPRNAIFVTLCTTIVCALIIIGSTIAFNILLTISATGLLTSYMIVIGVVLRKRLVGEPLLASRWKLGIWGIPINVTAICFCLIATCFIFWPAAPNPTPASMNWSCLMYGVVVIGAVAYYHIRGKREYDGPVVRIVELVRIFGPFLTYLFQEYVRKDIL